MKSTNNNNERSNMIIIKISKGDFQEMNNFKNMSGIAKEIDGGERRRGKAHCRRQHHSK